MKFVSWACITHGREKYVPNIIRMFLAQDYKGRKEFVLLNDDPDINYVFDHPEVRIYNWDHRFRNIRIKHNACVSLCNGEVYMPVADDDEWEPHAMSRFIDAIGDDPFVAARGFWKKGPLCQKPVWMDDTIGGLTAYKIDFYKRMGGRAAWIWYPLGDHVRDDSTDAWILHPENLIDRVREAEGCYKEFWVHEKDGFFTWVRGTDHSNVNKSSPEKYFAKKRNPKIIKLEIGGNHG